ncbi:MAG: metallophosphoesterase [Prevotella sp.]|jgi:3',5'-cyclic AMP phosphodiesterase CpdA
MNKLFRHILFTVLLFSAFVPAQAQTPAEWKQMKADVNLYWVNDMGRNGYYDQKTIAELMGTMAETVGPEAVIAVGDIHHFNGVESVSDPLWKTNYELIYSHPELMCFWYPVMGNHEYRGNTQAVLDYANVSRRWAIPARYYSKVFKGKGCSVRIVFLDTTPLIDKYRKNTETYPDAYQQDRDKELAWLDSTLTAAQEDWVICVGHHPVYAQTKKTNTERKDMQKYLLPVFRRHPNVSVYGCGHIHNFQHIKMPGDNINYWVNSAAALSRHVEPIKGTRWCDASTGFTVISADKQQLTLYAINKEGKILYTLPMKK